MVKEVNDWTTFKSLRNARPRYDEWAD